MLTSSLPREGKVQQVQQVQQVGVDHPMPVIMQQQPEDRVLSPRGFILHERVMWTNLWYEFASPPPRGVRVRSRHDSPDREGGPKTSCQSYAQTPDGTGRSLVLCILTLF